MSSHVWMDPPDHLADVRPAIHAVCARAGCVARWLVGAVTPAGECPLRPYPGETAREAAEPAPAAPAEPAEPLPGMPEPAGEPAPGPGNAP